MKEKNDYMQLDAKQREYLDEVLGHSGSETCPVESCTWRLVFEVKWWMPGKLKGRVFNETSENENTRDWAITLSSKDIEISEIRITSPIRFPKKISDRKSAINLQRNWFDWDLNANLVVAHRGPFSISIPRFTLITRDVDGRSFVFLMSNRRFSFNDLVWSSEERGRGRESEMKSYAESGKTARSARRRDTWVASVHESVRDWPMWAEASGTRVIHVWRACHAWLPARRLGWAREEERASQKREGRAMRKKKERYSRACRDLMGKERSNSAASESHERRKGLLSLYTEKGRRILSGGEHTNPCEKANERDASDLVRYLFQHLKMNTLITERKKTLESSLQFGSIPWIIGIDVVPLE